MNLLRLLFSSLVFCFPMFTQSALAQVATLVADEMLVDPGGEITATGNVEIWFEGTKLTASKLVYNRDARSIKISGPIVLTDPANNAVLLADASELSADLRNGLLESAHLVLNNQLQIAARRTARIGGRYTQLENAIASTCRVCAANPVPLWQIRAKEIVHDQKQKRLFFRHAWLDVAGVPVFYLPKISIPEPGVRRATGFLPTKLHSTSAYGSTLHIPYFVTLGDHADVTLTGQIGQQTAGMNIRYRRAFANGDIEFRAEASREYLDPALRGYVDFQGNFRLKNQMRLAVKAETASDIDYMSDFSISGADAWNRSLELRKTTGTFNFGFLAQNEHSLRSYEQGYRDTLPENTAHFHTSIVGQPVSILVSI